MSSENTEEDVREAKETSMHEQHAFRGALPIILVQVVMHAWGVGKCLQPARQWRSPDQASHSQQSGAWIPVESIV